MKEKYLEKENIHQKLFRDKENDIFIGEHFEVILDENIKDREQESFTQSYIENVRSIENLKALEIHASDHSSFSDLIINFVDAVQKEFNLPALYLSSQHFQEQELSKLLENLATYASLRTLNLNDCNIGGDGAIKVAEFIAKNKSLTKIELSKNKLTLEGSQAIVKALQTNKMMRVIYLEECELDKKILFDFSQVFQEDNSLQFLVLAGNNASQKGYSTEVTLFCESLHAHTKLQLLNLNNFFMDQANVKDMAKLVATNQNLISLSPGLNYNG